MEREEGNPLRPSTPITPGLLCLQVVEEGWLALGPWLLAEWGWEFSATRCRVGPDCAGWKLTTLAFVKRRRRLTAPGSDDNSGGWKEPPWGQ